MDKIKNAVVIGATSGIGKQLAAMLVDDGYNVVITGRREAQLNSIWEKNKNLYIPVVQDVTDIDKIDSFFENLKTEFNEIDLIIYSSGVGDANYKLEWEQELPTLETNVLAATKIYGLAYNLFHEQGYGHLVGISSIASIRGNRHVPAYFASKAYQANYLESLWMKGLRSKSAIYVTDVQPGFVDTAMAINANFWIADVQKASRQIYTAIKRKKKKVYITKRWRLVAWALNFVPARLLIKFH